MVSGAPRSRMYEIDNSQIWTENSGLGVYMGLVADAGPLGINRCSTVGDLKSKYTKDGKITASHGVDYQVAKRICNTVGLELFIGRVCAGNALYAGAVVPCGTTTSAHALSTGLDDPNDYTFVTGSGETAEKAEFRFGPNYGTNYGGTAFYLPGHVAAVSFGIKATQEVNHIIPSIENIESIDGTYFKLPNSLGYVWFKIDDTTTDPGPNTTALAGLTGIPVEFTIEDSLETLIDRIVTAVKDAISNTVLSVSLNVDLEGITFTVVQPGLATVGSKGTTGWDYIRAVSGKNAIPYFKNSFITETTESESDSKTIPVEIEYNWNVGQIATATKDAINGSEFADYFNPIEIEIESEDSEQGQVVKSASLTISMIEAKPTTNASNNTSFPSPVEITTVEQGSTSAGTDAVFFYYNNPSEKGNNYGIKIYNSEDYPDKAAPGTFIVEVYTNANTRVPESTVVCSRIKDKTDDYNRSMYVEDVLERLTDIRAINNVNLIDTELPRSTDIVWFGGGSSGTFDSANNELLNEYINTCNVEDGDPRHSNLRDKEEYAVSLLLAGGFYAAPYLSVLDNIAQTRGDACHLCGCPLEYETAVTFERQLEYWVNEEALLTSSYSSMFSPHMKAYDDDNGKTYDLPVECCVAEQIAFANENYSIAEPILGFTRGTIQGVTGAVRRYTFTDDGTGTGDHLYDIRINPIRFFKDRGYVIWGHKTQQRYASKRDRLNVRLMLIALKPLLNQIQLNQIGELPTQATKKRLEGQLRSVLNIGVGRNWFKPNYQLIIEDDPVREAQHIQRIFYIIEPYDAIEYVQGYVVITNGVVTEITQEV